MWSKIYFSEAVVLVNLLFFLQCSTGQNLKNGSLTWCTVSESEFKKCQSFANATIDKKYEYGSNYLSLDCIQAFNKDECMFLLDQEKAQLTSLDAGEVFVGGRYHSLVPIMQETYHDGLPYQYAVAVVKKGSDINNLRDLRGRKACFAGVGMLAGWITPIYNLMKEGLIDIIDCNNHVKSTIKFFGPSCAVNSLVNKYNPLGDNSDQLCKLCIGKVPGGKCTNSDPYSGYEGAFNCLRDVGEIAFLVHNTISEVTTSNSDFDSVKSDDFELLCLNGDRKPVNEYRQCNWGRIPSVAIVTSSATPSEIRIRYQRFLEKSVDLFGKNRVNYDNSTIQNSPYQGRQSNFYESNVDANEKYTSSQEFTRRYFTPSPEIQHIENKEFSLFESFQYDQHHNLLFSDSARNFTNVPENDQTYAGYLGKSLDIIMSVRRCPVDRMTLCVTSEPELEKCIKMKIAMKAQLLKPDLTCSKRSSQIYCMQDVQNGHADVTVLDASDVYTAGLRYNLAPIISEVYNLGAPEYYVVAVAREEDNNTDLTYLKNKNTCHSGIYTAAGWVYPMAYLLANTWIRGYGCDSLRAASEYFTKSCVPGALNPVFNLGDAYDNLCDLCHGTKDRYCRRDASEDYFGNTGAFRCLVEGGGDVAFVKHTTVAENTDGKRREFWARNTFTKDFQLLCPDGTRKSTSQYMECNLGKVAANAIVTRGGEDGYNETEINAYINFFIYAQQFYGRKELDDYSFGMFYSTPPYSDLIFQDATTQLVSVPHEKRQFSAYLGPNFMRARRLVDCFAGASAIQYSIIGTISMLILTLILGR